MRIRFFLSLIIATITTGINAQHLAVPDSILSELHTIKVSTNPWQLLLKEQNGEECLLA